MIFFPIQNCTHYYFLLSCFVSVFVIFFQRRFHFQFLVFVLGLGLILIFILILILILIFIIVLNFVFVFVFSFNSSPTSTRSPTREASPSVSGRTTTSTAWMATSVRPLWPRSSRPTSRGKSRYPGFFLLRNLMHRSIPPPPRPSSFRASSQ